MLSAHLYEYMILNLYGSEIVRGLSLTEGYRIYLSLPGPEPESRDERTPPALLRQLTATSATDCRQVHLPRNTEFTFAI